MSGTKRADVDTNATAYVFKDQRFHRFDVICGDPDWA